MTAEPIELESNYTCASDGGRWDDERCDGWAWGSDGTAGLDAASGPAGWLPRGRERRRDRALLAQMAAMGTTTRDSLVWKQGMAEWRRAGDVGELASVFGGVPAGMPPIPPTA